MPTIPYASPPARPPAASVSLLATVAAVAAVAIGGALVYARSSSSVVLYRLLTDGLIALVWVISSAGLGTFLLRLLLRERPLPGTAGTAQARNIASGTPGDRPINDLLYFVTSAALGLGVIGLAVLGLGLAGLLNQITAIALLAPGIPFGWRALRARKKDHLKSVAAAAPDPSQWRWLWLAAGPFLAIALIGTMVPPGLIWNPEEPHGYDVVEYHLQVPREWYEAGRIVPLKHNVFSYFPMGVEVHYLLAMEIDGGPWAGMYLAQLMHLALIVLTVLAAFAVAMQFAPNRASATVAAVALATIPWMPQLGAIAYNEGGLLLYATVSIGWAMLGLSAPADFRPRLRRFILAGGMAGFACGTKLTAVPELLLGVPVACVIATVLRTALGAMGKRTRLSVDLRAETESRGQASTLAHGTHSNGGSAVPDPILKSIRSVVKLSLVFGIAGLLTFLPWLARNEVWAGNPVFPEATSILGKAHWTDAQVERYKRANHEPGADQIGAIGHIRAVWEQLIGNWQFGYVLLPLGALSLVLLARSGRLQRPQVLLPTILLLFLTVFWIGFTHLQSRFFLLGAPLAVLLIAQVDWGRWLRPVAALVLVAAVIGWWGLNRRFVAFLWQPSEDMHSSLDEALGRLSLQWLIPVELDAFPRTANALRDDPSARVNLIGDSRAFYYQIPMSRLRYRTIFDLNTNGLSAAPDAQALIAAWSGRLPGSKPAPGEWLVIDGSELERFFKYYRGVPAPPPQWAGRTTPLVVEPEDRR